MARLLIARRSVWRGEFAPQEGKLEPAREIRFESFGSLRHGSDGGSDGRGGGGGGNGSSSGSGTSLFKLAIGRDN